MKLRHKKSGNKHSIQSPEFVAVIAKSLDTPSASAEIISAQLQRNLTRAYLATSVQKGVLRTPLEQAAVGMRRPEAISVAGNVESWDISGRIVLNY
jgi:hypothetical protein